ncbi:UNVERIFIED_CONTAM: CDPK-related protein kinase [Sesamum radiatum]|uniref:non-specific serine/threonine protein kinase n=1 Tax=Sesamum radiatum TaxID=300843 RepID=A0AAW2RVJ6_SESRA
MGLCASKPPPKPNPYASKDAPEPPVTNPPPQTPVRTPRRRPFPPPSPAKHLKAVLLRTHAAVKLSSAAIKEGEEEEPELDKSFGFSKKFGSRFEVGEEVGRGHFGYTCSAIARKGELQGRKVAVKIIPKSKMTTAIAIEDVRREVKILRALRGHPNIVQLYDAFEDADNVYIVMELCEGGELLDRILARGGKFSEDYAKAVIIQILNAVAFYHLWGVVHRDIKPELCKVVAFFILQNFLFTSKDEISQLKAIDFGLSDFVRPDQKLTDVVGSAYYVAPEVLHRLYGAEADVWSIGVIAYILLCGGRPFWARTESGLFRSILKANPSFDVNPWPSLSPESKNFVSRLLDKDPSRRISAAQALCHPWVQNHNKVKLTLDILVFRLMKAYMRSSSLRKAALRALSKTLTVDELFYVKQQFTLMLPDENGGITLETIKMALKKNATGAAEESHFLDLLNPLNALQFRRMYFEEFCAAALSVGQLEALGCWEKRARCAYEIFEKDGNRAILIEELASELALSPSLPFHTVIQEWIRLSDGKLTFPGFVKLLREQSTQAAAKIL